MQDYIHYIQNDSELTQKLLHDYDLVETDKDNNNMIESALLDAIMQTRKNVQHQLQNNK